ncbi:hypothetical protein D3C75_729870 [compost metagenome]
MKGELLAIVSSQHLERTLAFTNGVQQANITNQRSTINCFVELNFNILVTYWSYALDYWSSNVRNYSYSSFDWVRISYITCKVSNVKQRYIVSFAAIQCSCRQFILSVSIICYSYSSNLTIYVSNNTSSFNWFAEFHVYIFSSCFCSRASRSKCWSNCISNSDQLCVSWDSFSRCCCYSIVKNYSVVTFKEFNSWQGNNSFSVVSVEGNISISYFVNITTHFSYFYYAVDNFAGFSQCINID